MKSDAEVALPLIGILVVAVVGLGLYLMSYVFGVLGITVAPWIIVALVLVPIGFLALVDFSRTPKN